MFSNYNKLFTSHTIKLINQILFMKLKTPFTRYRIRAVRTSSAVSLFLQSSARSLQSYSLLQVSSSFHAADLGPVPALFKNEKMHKCASTPWVHVSFRSFYSHFILNACHLNLSDSSFRHVRVQYI